jgi:hypothetical protein
MLRIIVRTVNTSAAAHVGGPVEIQHTTFDIEAPEVEKFLLEPKQQGWQYAGRDVVGVEVRS